MCDGKNVAERVVVEMGHRSEISCERLALALLKLLNEKLDVLGNDLLSGGMLAVAVERRILTVRRGAIAAAVAVAVVVESHVFCPLGPPLPAECLSHPRLGSAKTAADRDKTKRPTVGVRRKRRGK